LLRLLFSNPDLFPRYNVAQTDYITLDFNKSKILQIKVNMIKQNIFFNSKNIINKSIEAIPYYT